MLRVCEHLPRLGSGMLVLALVAALCSVGGNTREKHHNRKLWRNYPKNIDNLMAPMPYHDHQRKNKDAIEFMKTELHKNVHAERKPEEQDMCGKVEESKRFDCLPQGTIDEETCVQRGCCWKQATIEGAPYCFYPSQYDSFRFLNMTEDKHAMTVYYEKARSSGYPDDFEVARMEFNYLSDDVLQIKISDANNKRFEPPYPEITLSKPLSKMKYRVHVDESRIGFKIIRNADNVTIIDTQDVGGLILSDKFLQISAILPTDHVFGLGERRGSFMNDMNWQTMAIFNRDRVPEEGSNLYGAHPFYMAVEPNGNTHGMVLVNSNAMDVVLQPSPGITYRTIGGILNLFVLVGPSPKQVVSQYTELVGRPFMPPYWSLGFHLCKYNYGDLNVTKQVWQSNRDAGIPFDTQWNDIDYMRSQNDFTYDTEKFAGLPEFVKKLHDEGMHYVMIIDPGVSASEELGTYPPFDRGLEMDIFIKNSSNQPFVGKVWNSGSTAFPDFTHPNSTAYWVEMLADFHKLVSYDGIWIDMNEPSNFPSGPVDGECVPERVPYRPNTHDATLNAGTLCMDADHYAGKHYDVHNMYAITEGVATNVALTQIRGKRPFIITRASFIGMGRYTGHWSGDINSRWHDMKMSIPELLSFSMFGIPMMGADICGFGDDTTVELCMRWMQLGAFYPFSRNHNAATPIPQDPVSLGPVVVQASRRALRIRYQLLPYYYTLFWRAHVYGDTLVRPLFFESPENGAIHDIDDQFLIGPYIMIAPILEQGANTTNAMFPGPNNWYNFLDGLYIDVGKRHEINENQTVSIRGGAIVPLQEPAAEGPVTTSNTRNSPMQLMVVPDKEGVASGELYWDDGDSLNSYEEKQYSHMEFSLNNMEIKSNIQWYGYGVPSLNKITILNQAAVKTVSVNNAPCEKPCEFLYLSATKVLQVTIDLPSNQTFSIKWT